MADRDDENTYSLVQVHVLQEKVRYLETQLEKTNQNLKILQQDKDSALKWGVVILGSGVISLALWIFNSFTSTAK